MRFNTRFLATAETKAFFEELGLTECIKESADGVCELRAASVAKLQALVDLLDERSPVEAVKSKLAQLAYTYLEAIEDSSYIDLTVDTRAMFKESGLIVEVRLAAGNTSEAVRLEYPVPEIDPEQSPKLAKFYPLAKILTRESSALYSAEVREAISDFALGEQVYSKVKRSADHNKEIRKAAKTLLERFDPKKNSVVDIIIQGEKDAVALIKKSVNIAKPIDFEVTRYQISAADFPAGQKNGPSGKGYQSVINFSAGGHDAHFVISALHPEGYRSADVVLYAVVITGKSQGKVTNFFEEKWRCKELPGRSEEEFKKIMTERGLRHAKGGLEKKYNEIAASLKGFKIEKSDDEFLAVKKVQLELDNPGRGDQMQMNASVHKKIEDALKSAAQLCQDSNFSLNVEAEYEELDYYDGCDSYDIPSYVVKKNVYAHRNRTSNTTPKGWMVELYVRLEIPADAKLARLQAIADKIATVEIELQRPEPRYSGFGTPRW